MGIVDVAFFAATAAAVLPGVTITVTPFATSSAASLPSISLWPRAQRYSTVTFCPSTKPPAASPF